MIRPHPAAKHASTTVQTIARPPTGKTTLGRSDFIRVPLPAARMMAAGFIVAPPFRAVCLGKRRAEVGGSCSSTPPGKAVPQAGRPGFEPGQTEPKSAVLPLHHRPVTERVRPSKPPVFRGLLPAKG